MYSITLKQNKKLNWDIIIKQNNKLYLKFIDLDKTIAFKKAMTFGYYFQAKIIME